MKEKERGKHKGRRERGKEVGRKREIKREDRTCKVAIYRFCSLH